MKAPLFTLAALLCLLARSQPISAQAAAPDYPDWVMRGSGAYPGPRGEYLILGVGAASGDDSANAAERGRTADRRAQVEVQKVLEVLLATCAKHLRDVGARVDTKIFQEIATRAGQATVMSARWDDHKDTVYALARLDVSEVHAAMRANTALGDDARATLARQLDLGFQDLAGIETPPPPAPAPVRAEPAAAAPAKPAAAVRFAASGLTLLIAPLKPEGVEASHARILTEVLRGAVIASGRYTVVSPEEMPAITSELERQISEGCDSSSCIAEVGGALGAQKMLTGLVGKLGRSLTLTLKLIDIGRAKAEQTAQVMCKDCEIDDLADRTSGAVTDLIQRTGAAPQ